MVGMDVVATNYATRIRPLSPLLDPLDFLDDLVLQHLELPNLNNFPETLLESLDLDNLDDLDE